MNKKTIIAFCTVFLGTMALLNIENGWRSKYIYIFPLPIRYNSFTIKVILIVTALIFFSAIFIKSEKTKKAAVWICTVIHCGILLAVGYGMAVGAYRIANIENERFPVKEIDLAQLEEMTDSYSGDIIFFSKAGCPDCEEAYKEITEFAENYPVFINYYDCSLDKVNNRDRVDKIAEKFNITQVPTILVLEWEKATVFEYSPDMVKDFRNYIYSEAENGFYFTDYKTR